MTPCASCEMLEREPLAPENCRKILAHVRTADYFELLGLARSYELNATLLARKYLSISRNIHPDRYAGAGEEMQSFALRISAVVNRAHDVLKESFLRAEYLLESAGGPSAGHDKRVPPDLLPQVMSLREEIDEAKSSVDHATLDRIRQSVSAQRDDAQSRIAELCRDIDRAGPEAKSELRLQLNAMRYFNNLLSQL